MPPRHPGDAGAVLLGTFSTTVTVPGVTFSFGKGFTLPDRIDAGGEGCQMVASVSVWRTPEGKIDYVIDATSVTLSGECGALDDLSTASLFAQLSVAAVEQGISLGYSPCGDDCPAGPSARAYVASCVTRHGSGSATTFAACDPGAFCHREFSICCTGGFPVVAEVPRNGAGCTGTGGCQPTCTDGGVGPLN